MTNTRGLDGTVLAACILFVVLMARSFRMCAFVFLSVNVHIFRAAATQVQAKGTASPSPGPARDIRPKNARRESASNNPECGENPSTAARVAKKTPPVKQTPEARKTNVNQSPPPYSLNPPTAGSKPLEPGSLVELYESIMASDAQTIEVQQQTMASQQEIIRAQAQMIQNLRRVLEEQDRQVEDLDEVARGLRLRRPGMDVAPRSRSS